MIKSGRSQKSKESVKRGKWIRADKKQTNVQGSEFKRDLREESKETEKRSTKWVTKEDERESVERNEREAREETEIQNRENKIRICVYCIQGRLFFASLFSFFFTSSSHTHKLMTMMQVNFETCRREFKFFSFYSFLVLWWSLFSSLVSSFSSVCISLASHVCTVVCTRNLRQEEERKEREKRGRKKRNGSQSRWRITRSFSRYNKTMKGKKGMLVLSPPLVFVTPLTVSVSLTSCSLLLLLFVFSLFVENGIRSFFFCVTGVKRWWERRGGRRSGCIRRSKASKAICSLLSSSRFLPVFSLDLLSVSFCVSFSERLSFSLLVFLFFLSCRRHRHRHLLLLLAFYSPCIASSLFLSLRHKIRHKKR